MRAFVAALSVLNLVTAAGLFVLFLIMPDGPTILLAVVAGLTLQGGFTLAFIASRFASRAEFARRLQLGGSAVALIVGSIVFINGLLINFDSATADPEYGPMTMGLLMAAHGLASLFAFVPSGPDAGNPIPT